MPELTDEPPELAGVTTSELLSWRSGIDLVRAMAARLDKDPPQVVADWLNDHEATVTRVVRKRGVR